MTDGFKTILSKQVIIPPLALLTIVAFVIIFDNVCDHIGKDEVGSFCEKNKYSAIYLVAIFPDANRSLNYQLPAEIYRVKSKEEGYYDEYGVYWPPLWEGVYVKRVYFKNGGYITLIGPHEFGCHLNKEGYDGEDFGTYLGACFDKDEKEYWIELTPFKYEGEIPIL